MPRGRFLFALWDGGGTAPPELALVKRLVARDHDVVVLADPSLDEDVKRTGAKFEPWKIAPHRTSRNRESEIVQDWAAITPFGAFARARDRHAFRPANLFAREVRALFDAKPADAIVVDAMLFGGLVGAESTKARVAALIPMTSFLPARRRPPPALGLTPPRNAIERARDRALNKIGDALLWSTCLPFLNQARSEMNLAPIAHPLDQIRRADRVLVQTSAWFDFNARDYDNIRYVGPELEDPTWSESNDDVSFDVLVAFSTTFMDQVRILEKIISALGTLPLRALVTTGPAVDPREFSSRVNAPKNVVIRASASHAAVMAHASLVVTHGGHGTVIRALAHGVPLLCMPMGRDQSDNAIRAQTVGASTSISHRASVSAIRRAIALAVHDSRSHQRARSAQREIAREMEQKGDAAIRELESLVSTNQ